MILKALNAYYERLKDDPSVVIAPFGYSRQQIAFCVVLNPDGSLHEIEDLRAQNGNKLVPQSLIVLGNSKPSGSGINPGFLWDNPAYLLGYKANDNKPERTRASFEAFRERHLAAESQIGSPAFSAVCRFLESWDPAQAENHETLVDIATGFGVFRVRGDKHFVHEVDAVQNWAQEQLTSAEPSEKSTVGQCLVTGEIGLLARLHEPKIKGVWGAQSSGAAIVSFNRDAFESYGKRQSLNSPVGERVAFQYCTALNRLLARGSPQRIQIGDASTVFWTMRPSTAESLLPWVFDSSRDAEDDALKNRIHAVLSQIAQGKYPSELGDRDTPFFIMGLAPNAARISVRFWWVSTLSDLAEKLYRHFSDLEITHSKRDAEFPAVWQLLAETVRDSRDLPPLLGGSVMRAILTGAPYPNMLFSSVLRRIRADRQVRRVRAAIIKAHLNRNTRFGIDQLERKIAMSLDLERPEPSYHLGRLFAELEKTQEDALPNINDTIKDRYFGAASATPGSVFPRLIRLSQHHLGKLEKGGRTYHERRIQEIAGRLEGFPSHLSLKDQGLFAIGYYHHRQDIFTKKTGTASTTERE